MLECIINDNMVKKHCTVTLAFICVHISMLLIFHVNIEHLCFTDISFVASLSLGTSPQIQNFSGSNQQNADSERKLAQTSPAESKY